MTILPRKITIKIKTNFVGTGFTTTLDEKGPGRLYSLIVRCDNQRTGGILQCLSLQPRAWWRNGWQKIEWDVNNFHVIFNLMFWKLANCNCQVLAERDVRITPICAYLVRVKTALYVWTNHHDSQRTRVCVNQGKLLLHIHTVETAQWIINGQQGDSRVLVGGELSRKTEFNFVLKGHKKVNNILWCVWGEGGNWYDHGRQVRIPLPFQPNSGNGQPLPVANFQFILKYNFVLKAIRERKYYTRGCGSRGCGWSCVCCGGAVWLSGANAPLSNKHKINDVIMTSRSYHVTSTPLLRFSVRTESGVNSTPVKWTVATWTRVKTEASVLIWIADSTADARVGELVFAEPQGPSCSYTSDRPPPDAIMKRVGAPRYSRASRIPTRNNLMGGILRRESRHMPLEA